jgi:hypothetical protein
MKFKKIQTQIQKRGQRANYSGDEQVVGQSSGPYIAGSSSPQIGRGYADPMADAQARMSKAQSSFGLSVSNTNTAAGTTAVTLFGENQTSTPGTGVTVSSQNAFTYAQILGQISLQPRAISLLQITYANAAQVPFELSYNEIDPISGAQRSTPFKPNQVFTGNQFNSLQILLPVDMVLNKFNSLTFSQTNGANGNFSIVFWVSSFIATDNVLTGQSPMKIA